MDNNFVHLVNNSITKDHKEFHDNVRIFVFTLSKQFSLWLYYFVYQENDFDFSHVMFFSINTFYCFFMLIYLFIFYLPALKCSDSSIII